MPLPFQTAIWTASEARHPDATTPRLSLEGVTKPRRQQVAWTDALDVELSDRWFACQHHTAIGRDMGISPAAIRSRATRLGLPARVREAIVDGFDPDSPAAVALRARFVRRRCRVANVWFWTSRDGQRVSPLARASRRYAALCNGLDEAASGARR